MFVEQWQIIFLRVPTVFRMQFYSVSIICRQPLLEQDSCPLINQTVNFLKPHTNHSICAINKIAMVTTKTAQSLPIWILFEITYIEECGVLWGYFWFGRFLCKNEVDNDDPRHDSKYSIYLTYMYVCTVCCYNAHSTFSLFKWLTYLTPIGVTTTIQTETDRLTDMCHMSKQDTPSRREKLSSTQSHFCDQAAMSIHVNSGLLYSASGSNTEWNRFMPTNFYFFSK